jgi:hypothetical protein
MAKKKSNENEVIEDENKTETEFKEMIPKKENENENEFKEMIPKKEIVRYPIEHWANIALLKPWQLEGLRRENKFKPGKVVSEEEFKEFISRFQNKPLSRVRR